MTANQERNKAIAEEKRRADYEDKMTTGDRPFIVTAGNIDKICRVGGIDKKLLLVDLQAAKEANKPLVVHLKSEDVRAAGGLDGPSGETY